MSCNGCDEIIQVGNSGTDGWSPILALYEGECDGDPVTVHQLVNWVDGTGTRPDYNGNIMTLQWLIDNPIYLGSTGLVTDICDATNLLPADGTNGTNGTNGEQGPPGEDGCTPEISFTANVGEEKPIECTVQGVIDGCTSSWNINFPEEIFTSDTVVEAVTGSEAFTTAVEDAIDGVLNVTPTSVPVTISTSSSTLLQYDSSGNGIDPAPTLSLYTTAGDSWFDYYIIGNQMTIQFRFVLFSNYSGTIKLHVKIPANKTSLLGTGTPIMMNRATSELRVPQISGASDVGSGWLRINDRYDNSSTYRFWVPQSVAPSGSPIIIAGTYTFLIN
jgi:hypothetical protein